MTDEDFLECEEGEDDFVIKHIIVANKAIAKAKMELGEIKKVLQHNIDMQIIVTTSELIWKTVSAMEGGFALPTCVSVTSGEVRKAEKEAMFYDRDNEQPKMLLNEKLMMKSWGGWFPEVW